MIESKQFEVEYNVRIPWSKEYLLWARRFGIVLIGFLFVLVLVIESMAMRVVRVQDVVVEPADDSITFISSSQVFDSTKERLDLVEKSIMYWGKKPLVRFWAAEKEKKVDMGVWTRAFKSIGLEVSKKAGSGPLSFKEPARKYAGVHCLSNTLSGCFPDGDMDLRRLKSYHHLNHVPFLDEVLLNDFCGIVSGSSQGGYPFGKICGGYGDSHRIVKGLRVYCLITSISPVRVYMYGRGVARLQENKLASFDALGEILGIVSYNKLLENVRQKLSLMFLGAEFRWKKKSVEKGMKDCTGCFQALSIDISLDHALSPHVTAINSKPSLGSSSTRFGQVKSSFVHDAVSMVYNNKSVVESLTGILDICKFEPRHAEYLVRYYGERMNMGLFHPVYPSRNQNTHELQGNLLMQESNSTNRLALHNLLFCISTLDL